MNDSTRRAVGGFLLLAPAGTLVGSGLLGLDPPPALTHPFPVLVGMAAAVLLNLSTAVTVKARRGGGSLLGGVALQLRGREMNVAVISLGLLLASAIAAYLFVENFAPR